MMMLNREHNLKLPSLHAFYPSPCGCLAAEQGGEGSHVSFPGQYDPFPLMHVGC